MKKSKEINSTKSWAWTKFLSSTKSQSKKILSIVDKITLLYIIEEAVNSGVEDIHINLKEKDMTWRRR